MAIILGEIDTLSRLIAELRAPGLNFNSLEDIISFRANWKQKIETIKKNCREKLLQEIVMSEQRLGDLELEYQNKVKERGELLKKEKEEINSKLTRYSNTQVNILKKLYFAYKTILLSRRKRILEVDFENEVKRPLTSYVSDISSLFEETNYKKNNIESVVSERADPEIKGVEIAAVRLEAEKDLLSGAIGEQGAVDELKRLPDTFYIINNFRLKIDPALPRQNENGHQDFIRSIQVDHIVIGPPGVFVIETKNWSHDSMENPDLFSPIMQLHRSSYALFIYLQDSIKSGKLQTFVSNWGTQQISLKNILFVLGNKPKEEYPHIKICAPNDVNGYITYFNPVFSDVRIKEISDFLSSDERDHYWKRREQLRTFRGAHHNRHYREW